jgi:prepilin-type N-terminal cleavage/methylation domain-containing protein
MTRRPLSPFARARQAMRKRMSVSTAQENEGFTLIELVVVVAILPIVVGGIAVALISVFSLQNSVSNRVSDSNDALVASSVFNRDVQSAQMITTATDPTNPSALACGASGQSQLLAFEWGASSGFPGGYQHVVSYVETTTSSTNGTATVNVLVRQVCSSGTASTGYTTQRVSTDIGTPSVLISPTPANVSTQWASTLGVTSVVINVNEPGGDYTSAGGATKTASDQYKYSLVGLPGRSTSNGTPSDPSQDIAGQCSFATPGSGMYANQLCFVDFTTLPSLQSAAATAASIAYCGSSTPRLMTMGITDTADTLEFCITTSGNTVAPHVIPTYYNAGGVGGSEAYLGNNGFYTGVTTQPALYQTQMTGISTISFTNIQVLDSSGNPASGWTMVTGDAETTDAGEWMNFTSNLNWSILPNSGASDLWGDDCYNGGNNADTPTSGVWAWTGASPPSTPTISAANLAPLTIATSNGFTTGVKSIFCKSDTSRNKTGAIMVQAQEPQASTAPQTMTATMYGSGLEAVFLAVLL